MRFGRALRTCTSARPSSPDLAAHDATLTRAYADADADVSHIVKLSSGRTGDPAAGDPIPSWHRAGEQSVRETGVARTVVLAESDSGFQ